MKQPNRIKAAMRAGRKACGYGLTFPSPWVIDILGKLDFDYVFIDGEHGPFDLERLEDLCRAAERYHLTTYARVPDIGSSTILRNTRLGRTVRICNSGGKQKSTVVKMPVASPARPECQGRRRSRRKGKNFPNREGNIHSTPNPKKTPIKPPTNPNSTV